MTVQRLGALGLCFIVLAGCSSPATKQSGQSTTGPTGPRGTLLFVGDVPEGTTEVFRQVESGLPEQLTEGAHASYPVALPGGAVLFNQIDDRDFGAAGAYIVGDDGGSPELAKGYPRPTFTPRPSPVDPSRVVLVTSAVEGHFNSGLMVVILNTSTGKRQLIPSTQMGPPGFPDWSPDGTSVVFQVHTDGADQLFTAPIGEEPTPLTSTGFSDTNAVWSPDGQWIAFASDRANRDKSCASSGCRLSIFAIHPDGTGLQEVTTCDDDFCLTPAWSPDSEWITYAQAHPGTAEEFVSEIKATSLDRKETVTLVPQDLSPAMASWVPAES